MDQGVTAAVATSAPAATGRASRLDRPAQVALLLGAAGVLYRLGLLLADVPPTNSDEATMGLAALHIADGRDFPAFFYGQTYMGTLEAYLAAPLVWAFGPSTLALRLPALALYAAFVFLAYRLARRLYTPWLAVVTVAVLALGSDRVIKNQLISAGGYPEISPLAALLFLLALARPRGRGSGAGGNSPVTAVAFGLVGGLLVWDDWLILPYLAAATAVLLARAWRRPRLFALTAGAAVVGAAPLLVHLGDSLPEYLRLNQGGTGFHPYGGVLFGIPMGLGMCLPGDCAPWQMWWGVAVPILLVGAGVLGVRAYRSAEDPQERLRQVAQLALVAAAVLTLILYARSAAAGETPVESARYLSPLLVSTPAIVWPLWRVRVGRVVVAAALGTMLVASAALVAEAPAYADRADRVRQLAGTLERFHADRVYSDYWTCNLLMFATSERVICAVVGDDLRPGFDRYPAYRRMVESTDRPAYVAPAGTPMDARLRDSGFAISVAGYHIYR
jgi:4-amino-4-deoxy-L-arabinose transferase-like glycosyltransferase